ncbi:hypothetical protein P0O24_08820 [Methanotrichaceae archaeon M04Ac]|uniref:Uncharacterized protein n=1 Tax=Candidatus Methanocrinis alkalitolerans TaxID=3033395 RepID=A0ABT5XG36_9EURY|nr:hypothetical protein [Candidatus Methanocrinis alkalitolerans]MDF0593685.1 hypothetical protein [Candidatus Methanocrinis alkalitolerans]
MQGRNLALILLMVIAPGVSAGLDGTATPTDLNSSETLSHITERQNGLHYIEEMTDIRVQYNEDLGYSSDILDEFVKKNITNRDAVMVTMAILVLASRTKDAASRIDPPDDYVKYHFYVQRSLDYLEEYLWNMGKFYETGNNAYAILARDAFNLSVYYYERSIEEFALVQKSGSADSSPA